MSTQKWAVGVFAVLVAAAAVGVVQGRNRPSRALYRFPAGFRGDWFLVPDRSLPPRKPGRTIVLDFDRRGLCRVEQGTYDALRDWMTVECRVGGAPVDYGDRMDLVAGRVSVDLGGVAQSIAPDLARIAPYYDFGFVGDLDDLKKSIADPRSNEERLRDLLLPKKGKRR